MYRPRIDFTVRQGRQVPSLLFTHRLPHGSSKGRKRLSIASRARKMRECTVSTGHSIAVCDFLIAQALDLPQ